MKWLDYLLFVSLFVSVWCVYLWSTQPKYEDGSYVSIKDRVCKISKRLVCKRNKQSADDP